MVLTEPDPTLKEKVVKGVDGIQGTGFKAVAEPMILEPTAGGLRALGRLEGRPGPPQGLQA
jgi:hypothetical protein